MIIGKKERESQKLVFGELVEQINAYGPKLSRNLCTGFSRVRCPLHWEPWKRRESITGLCEANPNSGLQAF